MLYVSAGLGMAVGVAVGVLAAAVPSGEPSVVVGSAARLVGVVVLAALGAAGSVCLTVVARILHQRAVARG